MRDALKPFPTTYRFDAACTTLAERMQRMRRSTSDAIGAVKGYAIGENIIAAVCAAENSLSGSERRAGLSCIAGEEP